MIDKGLTQEGTKQLCSMASAVPLYLYTVSHFVSVVAWGCGWGGWSCGQGGLLSHPYPLNLKVKGDFSPGSEKEEKSRILAMAFGRLFGVLFKDHRVGGGAALGLWCPAF